MLVFIVALLYIVLIPVSYGVMEAISGSMVNNPWWFKACLGFQALVWPIGLLIGLIELLWSALVAVGSGLAEMLGLSY